MAQASSMIAFHLTASLSLPLFRLLPFSIMSQKQKRVDLTHSHRIPLCPMDEDNIKV